MGVFLRERTNGRRWKKKTRKVKGTKIVSSFQPPRSRRFRDRWGYWRGIWRALGLSKTALEETTSTSLLHHTALTLGKHRSSPWDQNPSIPRDSVCGQCHAGCWGFKQLRRLSTDMWHQPTEVRCQSHLWVSSGNNWGHWWGGASFGIATD